MASVHVYNMALYIGTMAAVPMALGYLETQRKSQLQYSISYQTYMYTFTCIYICTCRYNDDRLGQTRNCTQHYNIIATCTCKYMIFNNKQCPPGSSQLDIITWILSIIVIHVVGSWTRVCKLMSMCV